MPVTQEDGSRKGEKHGGGCGQTALRRYRWNRTGQWRVLQSETCDPAVVLPGGPRAGAHTELLHEHSRQHCQQVKWWKRPKCFAGRTDKKSVRSVHTRGAIQPQRTEVLTPATVWVTLRERGQTQKTTYFMTIYIKCPKTSNLEGQSR